MWVDPTVTASTMITQIQSRHKVRCHTGVVEIFGGSDVLAHEFLPAEVTQNPRPSKAWTGHPPVDLDRASPQPPQVEASSGSIAVRKDGRDGGATLRPGM